MTKAPSPTSGGGAMIHNVVLAILVQVVMVAMLLVQ
jgi:hypothetical protein